mmetsp:Transcript_4213/g.10039  ORF Transcript_4213/g.10039 Transcript_4213/m.10039 type:complete len:260 (+) Transcript_4213:104-883(+)
MDLMVASMRPRRSLVSAVTIRRSVARAVTSDTSPGWRADIALARLNIPWRRWRAMRKWLFSLLSMRWMMSKSLWLNISTLSLWRWIFCTADLAHFLASWTLSYSLASKRMASLRQLWHFFTRAWASLWMASHFLVRSVTCLANGERSWRTGSALRPKGFLKIQLPSSVTRMPSTSSLTMIKRWRTLWIFSESLMPSSMRASRALSCLVRSLRTASMIFIPSLIFLLASEKAVSEFFFSLSTSTLYGSRSSGSSKGLGAT